MSILKKIKPNFWNYQDITTGPFKYMFDIRRVWKLSFFPTSLAALVPLIFLSLINYTVMQNSFESEILMHTSRLVSNTRRTVTFFVTERKAALVFIVENNSIDELSNSLKLAAILENLKKGFGGFTDLGVIDSYGNQTAYAGPYKLEGRNYKNQEWFKEVLNRGVYISDVFLGFRQIPHMVIAIKHLLSDGSFYVLRATLDTEQFINHLANLEVSGRGDAFIINHMGILQTPSRYYGKVFEKIPLPVPKYSKKTKVSENKNRKEVIITGYAYIIDTPFILMIVKQKEELMKPWYKTRLELIGFLIISITIILVVMLSVSNYLVNRIYLADQRRVTALHEAEYSARLASVGRLAAGIAHEINNPLAIINEKAGLIKDIFTYKKKYDDDNKLMGIIDSIIASVDRCGTITKRLLSFARHVEVEIRSLNLEEVIREILGFMAKEAEYRSINISVDVSDDIPALESDKGKLQQIFINVTSNALAALDDGGSLDITAKRKDKDFILVTFTDNGKGIPESDLKRVFEPFFSTKTKSGGTGLGMSITYGLVQEIGGSISLESEAGKGTSVMITLPLKMKKKGKETDARTTC